MKKKFPDLESKPSFSNIESEILDFWNKNNTFQKSLDKNNDSEYVFYDGPPFANGLPHYGHLLAGTIKDVIPRYKTMRNYRVERRFGWDTHGLPVEYEVEQALNLNGANEIKKFGVDRFNDECRSWILWPQFHDVEDKQRNYSSFWGSKSFIDAR